MESLNNGHIGTRYFVHCREVVEVKNITTIGKFNIGASKGVLYTEVICIVPFIQSVLYLRFHCTVECKPLY